MAYRTLDEIDGLIKVLNTLSNTEDKTESRRYARNAYQYQSYKTDVLSEYNNANLKILEDDIDTYISTYSDNFSVVNVENYAILKQDIINQRRDNTDFTSSKAALNLVSDEGQNLFNQFHAIDETDSLTITQPGGTVVQYKMPDISDTSIYPVDVTSKKLLPNSQKQYDEDMVNYNKAKKGLKAKISKDMQANLESYIATKQEFTNRFTDRLSSSSQIEFFNKMGVTDDILQFGIQKLSNDGYISEGGAKAYSDGLLTGNMTSIQKYITSEISHDQFAAEEIVKDYGVLIGEYNMKKYAVDAWSNYMLLLDTNPDAAAAMGEETLFMSADGETEYSYNEVASDESLSGQIEYWEDDTVTLHEKLLILDERYQKNSLAGGPLTSIYPFETPILTTPAGIGQAPSQVVPASATTYQAGKLVLQDFNDVKTKIETRTGNKLTSDKSNLTERLVSDMNNISLKLDTEKKLIQPFLDDYDKAMEEYATLEGLLADYKEAGMAGLFTIDDPEADAIQKKMNDIEKLWFGSLFGKGTPPIIEHKYIAQYKTANPLLYKFLSARMHPLSIFRAKNLQHLKELLDSEHESLDKNYKAKSNILEKIK